MLGCSFSAWIVWVGEECTAAVVVGGDQVGLVPVEDDGCCGPVVETSRSGKRMM